MEPYHHFSTTTTATHDSVEVSSAPVGRRKLGRPRKYRIPAAKKTSTTTTNKKKNLMTRGEETGVVGLSPSYHSLALGRAGKDFTPHVINVAPGEDVGQKLMLFLEQSKREMCVCSASGSISKVSLRQPSASGEGICITYEELFEIISLSGSYVHNDVGGKPGGLSICLSNTNGQFIGGRIGGPLKAAGPVQVTVGTFLLDHDKDAVADVAAS